MSSRSDPSATEISSTRPRRRRRDSCRASLTAIEMSQGRKALGIADGVQLAPGDRPGRLDGLLGQLGVAARDDEADAAHVGVVGVHDAREGDLVAARGEAHQPCRGFARAARHGHHRRIDARPTPEVIHRALACRDDAVRGCLAHRSEADGRQPAPSAAGWRSSPSCRARAARTPARIAGSVTTCRCPPISMAVTRRRSTVRS